MSNLNLARKLRPKNFNEIIGQDLSVSMLKNSLYINSLFPVYLFSGQRGCGKTSTARVFGCAINCETLSHFQAGTQKDFPCLTCDSCKSMLKSSHPDFIEMDAASHTGVDSVRQIIESCTYMPLSGSKKIYLIDEAHMLSKAAFNAFLKILEEPPASTIFILATTEIQKIPETVRSRCFQVIFNPVQNDILFDHIKTICSKEGIAANDDAIKLLVQENDGSVRDAINTLEQVRYGLNPSADSGQQITKELVLKSLGKISESQLNQILLLIIDQNPQALLEHLQEIKFENLSAQNIWNMIVQLLRLTLWIKYEVKPTKITYSDEQKELANKCTINRLHALMQIMWSQERLFLQTPQKHAFLENVLLQMCHQVNIADIKTLIDGLSPSTDCYKNTNPIENLDSTPPKTNASTVIPKKNPIAKPSEKNSFWDLFVSELTQTTKDPLLVNIFKQAQFVEAATKDNAGSLKIRLSKNSPFFQDKINETKALWEPLVKKQFPSFKSFTFLDPLTETQQASPKGSDQSGTPVNRSTTAYNRPLQGYSYQKSYPQRSFAPTVNISDTSKWPQANLLTKNFSGKIEKVSDMD